MEDLIKKIIEVDKQARKKTEESQKQLADSKIAIEQRKIELEQHYNESVDEIIELTTQQENEKVLARKAEIAQNFAAADKKLANDFEANKERWVEELVQRALD